MRLSVASFLAAVIFPAVVQAQKVDRESFTQIDSFVAQAGPLPDYNLKVIVDSITYTAKSELDKVRAIYVWEANNIAYDCNAYHHPNQYRINASTALKERKSICGGYADLFKMMCDLARIECVSISGISKAGAKSIGKPRKKDRHEWNAVRVKNTWYLVDVTWGAGTTDKKVHVFTKQFTDAWFFPERHLFALSHFPDDKKWQLLDTPVTKPTFVNAPVVGAAAIITEVYPGKGMKGALRSKSDTSRQLVFRIDKPERLQYVIVATGKKQERTRVPYTIDNNELSVTVPYKKHGKYPVNVYLNDDFAFAYKAEVKKRALPKKKKKPAPKKKAPAKTKTA